MPSLQYNVSKKLCVGKTTHLFPPIQFLENHITFIINVFITNNIIVSRISFSTRKRCV